MGESKCFLCDGKIMWEGDFTFEELCVEGEGVVHMCKCSECGAEYEVYVAIQEGEDADV